MNTDKNIIMAYIRGRLHDKRFDMSDRSLAAYNQSVLNTFAYLDFYSNVTFLFIAFHKGSVNIFYNGLKYKYNGSEKTEIIECGGYSTAEIIYEVLYITNCLDKVLKACKSRSNINR